MATLLVKVIFLRSAKYPIIFWPLFVKGLTCVFRSYPKYIFQTVVTANHCIRERGPSYVTAGHINRQNSATESGYQSRGVLEVIKHPEYRKRAKFDNDIAIQKLETPFDETEFVKPACLPDRSFKAETGRAMIVSGWDMTE